MGGIIKLQNVKKCSYLLFINFWGSHLESVNVVHILMLNVCNVLLPQISINQLIISYLIEKDLHWTINICIYFCVSDVFVFVLCCVHATNNCI